MSLLNFERYLLVTTLVMAAVELLTRWLPLPDPRVRLRFLYLTLIVCLVAPFCLMHQERVGMSSRSIEGPFVYVPASQMEASRISFAESLWKRIGTVPLVVFGIGLLRILWLCVGLIRLSLYRIGAQPVLPLPDHLRAIRTSQRVDASLFISNQVNGPVTFGLIDQTILLPPCFHDIDEAQQSAIVCHELVHVRRNDAVKVLGEEVLRSLLWFHPCVWWLIDRIQLCREQLVDAESIAITEDRESYLEALLVFAQRTCVPDLAPATSFLKRHHLLERVKSIASEVTVSTFTRRMNALALYTVMPCLLALAIWRMPLVAQPQIVPDTPGVTVLTPYGLQHRSPVEVRSDAEAGEAVVAVTVNDAGDVTGARVVSGPAELCAAVLRSVRAWHFSTPALRSFDVAVRFNSNSPARVETTLDGWDRPMTIRKLDVSALPEAMRKDFLAQLPVKEGDTINAITGLELFAKVGGQDPRIGMSAHQGVGEVEVKYFLRTSDPSAGPTSLGPLELFQIARIEAPGFDELSRQRFLETLGISLGQTMTFEEFERKLKLGRELEKGVSVITTGMANPQNNQLRQIALRIIPPPQTAPATINRIDASALPDPLRQQVLDNFGFREGDIVSNDQIAQRMPALRDIDRHVESVMTYTNAGSPAVEIRFYLKPDSTGVSSAVRATIKPIYTVPPVYPPLALKARIQGTVRFTMIVGPDGTPQRIQLVSGHPLLVPAATEAAKQYRFPPSSEEVQTAVDVTFTLNQ